MTAIADRPEVTRDLAPPRRAKEPPTFKRPDAWGSPLPGPFPNVPPG